MPAAATLERLQKIIGDAGDGAKLSPTDITFLRLAKDELVQMAAPATGLTIAYTTLVIGSRSRRRADANPRQWFRISAAEAAYPGLVRPARFHRISHVVILIISLVTAMTAISQSARVSLGKALLQTRQELRVEQAKLWDEKQQLEGKDGNPLEWGTPSPIQSDKSSPNFDYCAYAEANARTHANLDTNWPTDENGKPLPAYASPKGAQLCAKDKVLAMNFGLSHEELGEFVNYWPELVGFPFTVLTALEGSVNWVKNTLVPGASKKPTDPGDGHDLEWRIAPTLIVVGNYGLPVFFAALGAAAFVVLDFYKKVHDSTLSPRDRRLGWIRLVLGLVVGACIGLLFSSYGPAAATPDQGLIGALTLSASAISFLAGFGVEGVFGMLDTLVKRVFAVTSEQK